MSLLSQPIGIFDSGTGGLTVARSVLDKLPREHIVYFGDTAHLPWGDKSSAAIRQYSKRIMDVLSTHHCKLIVIACNTASAVLTEREHRGIPLVNVVDPLVQKLAQMYEERGRPLKIGLIGTRQTVRSRVYHQKLMAVGVEADLCALETPALVPLIENGFQDHAAMQLILEEYLSHPSIRDIEVLLLACTHYPLIKPLIQNWYKVKGQQVDVLDNAMVTAEAVVSILGDMHLLQPSASTSLVSKGSSFFVSDCTDFFEQTATLFFGASLHLKSHPL